MLTMAPAFLSIEGSSQAGLCKQWTFLGYLPEVLARGRISALYPYQAFESQKTYVVPDGSIRINPATREEAASGLGPKSFVLRNLSSRVL